ncbi:glycosyltransferase family 39 protein [Pseudomonas sp. MWU13-2105]|uniref:glycosyltransferase family 39 protein n=1 Tax=Pseudomonas sp. MWU13-2105 TaxID=2935074 RepID=UPI002010A30F|nr:glycosyltransferase family 39 protein [Pseudomonas sp. MWU13-2105]
MAKVTDQAGRSISLGVMWWGIIVLAAGARLYGITDPYVWYDEAFSVWMSSLPPADIWFHTGRDVHPPLYYLLLHGWIGLLGKSVLAIRSMSVVAGTLTVMLCMLIVRMVSSRGVAMLAGILLALFPASVRLSQEARMYALEGLFLVGATLALVYWVRQTQRYRYLLIYAVCIGASLYTHYYAVLGVLAHWLYLIFLRFGSSIKTRHVVSPAWWLCNVFIFVIYTPWLFSLVDLLRNYAKIEAVGSVAWLDRGGVHTLPGSLWKFFTLQPQHSLFWPFYWLLPLVLSVLVGWVVYFDRTPYRSCVLLVIVTFFPMLALFCVSLFMPAYLERYIAFAALGIPVFMAIAVAGVSHRSFSVGCLMFFCVLALESVGLHFNYIQQGEFGYFKSKYVTPFSVVFDYIFSHRREGDIVVVGGGFFYFSAVYYNGTDQGMYLYDLSLDNGHSARPNGYGASTLMYETWDDHVLNGTRCAPKGTKRIWWLTGDPLLDVHVPYPGQWPEVDALRTAELDLRLYEAPAGMVGYDPCLKN